MATKKSTYLLIFNLFQTHWNDYRHITRIGITDRGGLEIESNENNFSSLCGLGAAK